MKRGTLQRSAVIASERPAAVHAYWESPVNIRGYTSITFCGSNAVKAVSVIITKIIENIKTLALDTIFI